MNKTLKYILIGVAVFFGLMLLIMLLMSPVVSDKMQEEMNNDESNQTTLQLQESQVSKVGYKDISTKELAGMLENKDFTLVNVHIPYIGDIKGTDVSISFNTVGDNLDKLPKNKTSKIVLYCQSGGMSAVAADTLSQLGYSNVYNVKGGMIQWQKDGNVLIKK